ncbi:MAG: hypothetical protein WBP81_14275 [Solirubrobacteraceae bacterium]
MTNGVVAVTPPIVTLIVATPGDTARRIPLPSTETTPGRLLANRMGMRVRSTNVSLLRTALMMVSPARRY